MTGLGVPENEPGRKGSWPGAFSPFSDPALQDSEVPYENLPVDRGHLLPPFFPMDLEMTVRRPF